MTDASQRDHAVDRYSFRPPRGARPMRRSVANAIAAERIAGVKQLVDDPRSADVCYVVCTRAAWAELQLRAALHSGNQRTGNARAHLISTLFGDPQR